MSAPAARLCEYCQGAFKPAPTDFPDFKVLLPTEAVNTIRERLWCRLCTIVHAKFRPHQYTGMACVRFTLLDYPIGLKLRLELKRHLVEEKCPLETDLALFASESTGDLVWAPSIPDTTESEGSRQFLSDQLQNCFENHQKCRSITPASEKSGDQNPTRLLWVTGPESEKVYLRDGSSLQETSQQRQLNGQSTIHYATLSHCWGDLVLPLLTQATVEALMRGISISDLPKTFRDAIQMTRTVGLEHLWIYSLCIFQDDPQDWGHEAQRMRAVYCNAVCNTAASGTKNSAEGLYFAHAQAADCAFWADVSWAPSTVKQTIQAKRYLVFTAPQWKDSVEMALLNQRGWVMQERVLSKRVISFTQHQLFWECIELRASETFPKGVPDITQSWWMYDKVGLKQRIFTDGRDSDEASRDDKLALSEIHQSPRLSSTTPQQHHILAAVHVS
ncbi:putative Heterokaryon incompatibility domain-containing protein [Seiridium cardinale]|uniref:Heterokaryon incompatibility domain-containing protein n=1 Tax=Seiridium cardinale TaxID=138064 RepID=A0ABR2XVN2_9PEZI